MKIDLNDDGALFPAAPVKRRGRPKGLPKTGGRQKAPGAVTPDELRALIGAKPVKYYLDALACKPRLVGGPNGTRVRRYPSSSDQSSAAKQLIPFVLPRLAHMEIDAAVASASIGLGLGEGGESLNELARKMVFLLASAKQTRSAEPITISSEVRASDKGSED